MIKVCRDHILPCRPVMDRNKDCASEEAEESEFVESVEMDCVNEWVGEVKKMMQILQQHFIRLTEKMGEYIEESGMLDSSFLYGYVCDYVTYYARSERKQEEKRLKMQAQKMKRERYEVLSDKHWCEVLESEERVMKLAGEGKMESAAEESYDECDKEMCRAMEGNRKLIGEMMRIWADDELFDMEQLLSENSVLIDVLTGENIGLFARLVLRGNIIRSKMNEELRRKFEAWIGDEEKEGEEKGEKGSADEGKRGEEEGKGVLMSKSAMKEWRKLQEKGWIDENLQPTTNMQMAAVIASVLGEKLKLKPKWTAFESLWGMKGLATRLTRALSGGSGKRYCDFQKEVEKALGMSHKRD